MKYIAAIILTFSSLICLQAQNSNLDSLGVEQFGAEDWKILKSNVSDKEQLYKYAKGGKKSMSKDDYKRLILKGKSTKKKIEPEEKIERKIIRGANHEEELDKLTEAHIPINAVWLGEPNPEKYRQLRNSVLIYNLWNPNDQESIQRASDFNQLEEVFDNIQVIHFVNPLIEKYFTAEELFQLWYSAEKNRPLVIGLNDKLLNRVSEFGLNAFVFNSNRSVSKVINSEKAIKDLAKYFEVFAEIADENPEVLRNHTKNYIDFKDILLNPSDILYLDNVKEIYVCDTWNNRVLSFTADGQFIETFGNTKQGFLDGKLTQSKFNHPSELAFHEESNTVYVIDDLNHAVRAVSLEDKEVKTVFGTGGRAEIIHDEVKGTRHALNTPENLKIENGIGYLTANSGKMLYSIDFENQILNSVVSYQNSTLKDGSLKKGSIEKIHCMAMKGTSLLVIDGIDNFNLREIDSKKIRTVLDSTVFEKIGLIHPTDMEIIDGEIWITDSYLNQIIVLDESGKTLRTIGTGLKSFSNGPSEKTGFNSPKNFSQMDESIILADALNSSVRLVNCATGVSSSFVFQNIKEHLVYPRFTDINNLLIEMPVDSLAKEIEVKIDFTGIENLDKRTLNLEVTHEEGVELVNFDKESGVLTLNVSALSPMKMIRMELNFASQTGLEDKMYRNHFYKLSCSFVSPELYPDGKIINPIFNL